MDPLNWQKTAEIIKFAKEKKRIQIWCKSAFSERIVILIFCFFQTFPDSVILLAVIGIPTYASVIWRCSLLISLPASFMSDTHDTAPGWISFVPFQVHGAK